MVKEITDKDFLQKVLESEKKLRVSNVKPGNDGIIRLWGFNNTITDEDIPKIKQLYEELTSKNTETSEVRQENKGQAQQTVKEGESIILQETYNEKLPIPGPDEVTISPEECEKLIDEAYERVNKYELVDLDINLLYCLILSVKPDYAGKIHKRGYYFYLNCPFHPPDNNTSVSIVRYNYGYLVSDWHAQDRKGRELKIRLRKWFEKIGPRINDSNKKKKIQKVLIAADIGPIYRKKYKEEILIEINPNENPPKVVLSLIGTKYNATIPLQTFILIPPDKMRRILTNYIAPLLKKGRKMKEDEAVVEATDITTSIEIEGSLYYYITSLMKRGLVIDGESCLDKIRKLLYIDNEGVFHAITTPNAEAIRCMTNNGLDGRFKFKDFIEKEIDQLLVIGTDSMEPDSIYAILPDGKKIVVYKLKERWDDEIKSNVPYIEKEWEFRDWIVEMMGPDHYLSLADSFGQENYRGPSFGTSGKKALFKYLTDEYIKKTYARIDAAKSNKEIFALGMRKDGFVDVSDVVKERVNKFLSVLNHRKYDTLLSSTVLRDIINESLVALSWLPTRSEIINYWYKATKRAEKECSTGYGYSFVFRDVEILVCTDSARNALETRILDRDPNYPYIPIIPHNYKELVQHQMKKWEVLHVMDEITGGHGEGLFDEISATFSPFNDKKIYTNYGDPDSGKSTVYQILKKLHGDAVTMPSLNKAFPLQQLIGKRVIVYDEVSEITGNEHIYKLVTGGPEIPHENKFEDYTVIENTLKTIMNLNKLPKSIESIDDPGLQNRFNFIIFNYPHNDLEREGQKKEREPRDFSFLKYAIPVFIERAIELISGNINCGIPFKTFLEIRKKVLQPDEFFDIMESEGKIVRVSKNVAVPPFELFRVYTKYAIVNKRMPSNYLHFTTALGKKYKDFSIVTNGYKFWAIKFEGVKTDICEKKVEWLEEILNSF